MVITINNHVCTITNDNINIKDSYQITSKDLMIDTLTKIKYVYPSCETFNRKESDLIHEWRAHNRLYRLGLFRSHTKDVDLNANVSCFMQLIYNIIGI